MSITKEGNGGSIGGDQSSVGLSSLNKQNNNLGLVDDHHDDDDSLHEHKPNGTLYVAPIERYVDDGELYQQKYNDYSRIKYWEFLLDRPRPPKLPFGHQSWANQGGNGNFGEEIHHFPKWNVYLLAVTLHHYWDYMYLYLCGAWIVLMTAHFDPLVREYILIPTYLLYFPLLLMFVTQLIPTLSVIYLVSKCNDLVKLVASRTFGSWVRLTSLDASLTSLSVPSPSPAVPVSLSHSLCLSLSLSHSLCLSLCVCLSLSHTLSVSVCISVFVSGFCGSDVGSIYRVHILLWSQTSRESGELSSGMGRGLDGS
jgi:hypothetical protein